MNSYLENQEQCFKKSEITVIFAHINAEMIYVIFSYNAYVF